MASRRKIVHEDFTYQLNKKYKDTFYYRCSKFSELCQAKLVVKGDTFTVKGIHTCITINSIADENNAIIESREYSANFITEKASHLELNPNQIYNFLLLSLKEKYRNMLYEIPPKKRFVLEFAKKGVALK
ncbi:hypothetical protein RF11_12678 [Thelohanellus kitauei]|uniref:FLYWCH-type domain-containing protein n=1 Tax=Thelohanellus kitauei TaxID=669202 RepID=A0A0C2JAJ9_THEKT|nr:hypothetical protein RF11_12678 [Thelohanellus kitauei]